MSIHDDGEKKIKPSFDRPKNEPNANDWGYFRFRPNLVGRSFTKITQSLARFLLKSIEMIQSVTCQNLSVA